MDLCAQINKFLLGANLAMGSLAAISMRTTNNAVRRMQHKSTMMQTQVFLRAKLATVAWIKIVVDANLTTEILLFQIEEQGKQF